jgi:hypothetical protein
VKNVVKFVVLGRSRRNVSEDPDFQIVEWEPWQELQEFPTYEAAQQMAELSLVHDEYKIDKVFARVRGEP